MPSSLVENNRDLWEKWTHLHLETGSNYQKEIDAFRAGECTLHPVDIEEIGEVRGKAFLHLMCHFGLDTLSWAKRGARVTGVDFSSASIEAARKFASDHAIEAEFLCADVYNLPEHLNGRFDIVYSEGGILVWLPNLTEWANAIVKCMKPEGVFYIRDSHPFRRVAFPVVLDGHGRPARYHYFSPEPTRIELRGSYAQPDAHSYHTAYFWVHGIGEIVSALCSAGLRIDYLHEFPKVYTDYPILVRNDSGSFDQHILDEWAVPSTFSIRASLR